MGACTGRKVCLEKSELENPTRRKWLGVVGQERESRFCTVEINERGVSRGGGKWLLGHVRVEWFKKKKSGNIMPTHKSYFSASVDYLRSWTLYSSTLCLYFCSPWHLSCQCPFLSLSSCWSPANTPELSQSLHFKSLLQNSQFELIFLIAFQLYIFLVLPLDE